MVRDVVKPSRLNALFRIERRQLKAISDAWIAYGAASFGVYTRDGDAIVEWQSKTVSDNARICKVSGPIFAGREEVGYLQVEVYTKKSVEARVNADAMMLSRLMGFEGEIEAVTSELIDAQDQIIALYRLSQSVRGHVVLEDIMHVLAAEAADLVKAQSVFLLMALDDREIMIQHPEGYTNKSILRVAFEIVQNDRMELHISDPDILKGVKNMFLVPMQVRGEVVAGLGLVDKEGGFASPDLKKIRAIAEYASARLENAVFHQDLINQARLQAELDMAADIQRHLMPQQLPESPGIQIAGMSIQAKQVGGDFYDFIKKPDENLVFIIADVAGKGMSSALLMATTRAVIRSRVGANTMLAPGSLLTYANADLYDDYNQVGKFTTAFVGRCTQQETDTLLFANAGHSPVIHCDANGHVKLLQANNMPLGVMLDNVYEDEEISFAIGDVLVLATDGFSEATSASGELFGYDRLLDIVQQNRHLSAQGIADTLLAVVQSFREGTSQDDDQTLVVLKRDGYHES